MNPRRLVLVAVLVLFTGYTLQVVVAEGYTGFITLSLAEAWAGQMFVDLLIALALFSVWMWYDARERRLPFWPYLLLTLTTGSIGALGYLVHREFGSEASG